MRISLFGAGFIGKKYAETYKNTVIIPRDSVFTATKNVLYMISTIHNYHPKLGDPYIDIYTNLLHFMKVLSQNKDKKGLVFNLVSTWFVYGDTQLPAREDSPCNPKGFYSITARAREQMLISYCDTYGINYRIIRLGNVIGIGDKKISRMKNALQFMVRELAQGREIELYKNGAIRDYIDVRDAVKAIKLIVENGELNQIYNVANGQGLNVNDLVQHAWHESGYTGRIKDIPVPAFHKVVQTPKMWMNIEKIKKLGYVQSHNIKTSVAELVHYYKRHEQQE